MNSIELKISIALLSFLLKEDKNLKYTKNRDRVIKIEYKLYFNRISRNLSRLIANRTKTSISNNNLIIKNRATNVLIITKKEKDIIIIISEYTVIINV